MTAQKQTDQKFALTNPSERKPWKKKSPIQVILEQIERVREDVRKREEELQQARRQLLKLEEAQKLLESA